MERFGEKLYALRQRDGLTLELLSSQLGVSTTFVWKLEKGKKIPNVAMVLKIAEIFGVTPNDLLLDEVKLEDELDQ